MKSLNFKVSIELYEQIKELAKLEHRSLTGQVVWMLNECIITRKMLKEGYYLTKDKSA